MGKETLAATQTNVVEQPSSQQDKDYEDLPF
jgi:hypothetical protein